MNGTMTFVEPSTSATAPIAIAHQFLENMVHDVDNAVGELIRKIEPVLGADFPRDSPADPKDEDRSELAKSLSYQAVKLRELVELIHSVNARIEL